MIVEEKPKLDEDLQLFTDGLKRCFSEENIEEIARETDFVRRKGRIKACEFVWLCCFMDVEVGARSGSNNIPKYVLHLIFNWRVIMI